ncbi:SET domain containing protein [Trypanosoma brucei equiperdum]|nr:SET domain containing protein [Trypanosoma brucei equiperdum]
MRLIESRQMHEWDNAADSSLDVDHPEDAPFGQGPERQQQRDGKSNLGDQSDYGEEARMEATWLWRFGFPRTEDEKAYVASHLWSKGLRRRVAQLTDVRRRGRPGEFVIGVPEGLQHLREQRERLERERFGGVKVFPPQNA